jgi:hypothetical protein
VLIGPPRGHGDSESSPAPARRPLPTSPWPRVAPAPASEKEPRLVDREMRRGARRRPRGALCRARCWSRSRAARQDVSHLCSRCPTQRWRVAAGSTILCCDGEREQPAPLRAARRPLAISPVSLPPSSRSHVRGTTPARCLSASVRPRHGRPTRPLTEERHASSTARCVVRLLHLQRVLAANSLEPVRKRSGDDADVKLCRPTHLSSCAMRGSESRRHVQHL